MGKIINTNNSLLGHIINKVPRWKWTSLKAYLEKEMMTLITLGAISESHPVSEPVRPLRPKPQAQWNWVQTLLLQGSRRRIAQESPKHGTLQTAKSMHHNSAKPSTCVHLPTTSSELAWRSAAPPTSSWRRNSANVFSDLTNLYDFTNLPGYQVNINAIIFSLKGNKKKTILSI